MCIILYEDMYTPRVFTVYISKNVDVLTVMTMYAANKDA